MDKIIVSQGVANAIESAKLLYDGNKNFFESLMNHQINGSWAEDREILHDFSTEDFAKALLCGYEIRETPEELLLKIYNLTTENDIYNKGYKEGCEDTLKILDIKIKGINL